MKFAHERSLCAMLSSECNERKEIIYLAWVSIEKEMDLLKYCT